MLLLPTQSEQIDLIATALCNAQAEFPLIRKTQRANYGEYASTYDILEPVRPILKKYGLAINICETILVETGQQFLKCSLILSGSNQWICSYGPLRDGMVKDAERGGCITFRARYLYKNLLGVLIPDDSDDNDDNNALVTQEEYQYLLTLSPGWQQSIKERNNITDLSLLPRGQFTGIVNYINKKESEKNQK